MSNPIKKSPWISIFNAGGCNGCVIECVACTNPKFDVTRLGIELKASAKHADILLVTGIVNKHNKSRLINVYESMAEPRKVIAIGTCAVSGGLYHNSPAFAGPLDKVIPVDIYVPGCAPRPEAVIDAIIRVLDDD
ncbi:MAG: NADH-quinone oxidoreductase subunit NuoB [Candidatus Micrarchaeota archaeon]